MENQHDWARGRGYTAIETGAIHTNAAMLSLNSRVGFRVIGTYTRKSVPKVMMLKDL